MRTLTALVLMSLIGMPLSLFAESPAGAIQKEVAQRGTDRHRFDPAMFGIGDRVIVVAVESYKGRVRGVDDAGITIVTPSGERTIAIETVTSIRRRTNGVTLGGILGAAGGFVAALPVIALFRNEGADASGPTLLLVAAGAGVGTAIDGMIGRYRLVYERP